MRELLPFAVHLKSTSRKRIRLASWTLITLFAALSAQAQPCDRSGCGFITCGTPAQPAPANLWGEIQPAEATFTACTNTGPAFCRDSTSFNEFTQRYANFPWFMAVDTQNGFVFTALAYGFEVWDARTTPATPAPLGSLSLSDFPVQPADPEIKWPLQHVSAPPGIDTMAAVAGNSGLGIAIINLSDKALPKLAYQNSLKEGAQVYAATVGGKQYAFLAAPHAQSPGVFIFDMNQALAYDHCSEAVPSLGEVVNCPGVYVGRLGTLPASFISGVDNYVVFSNGSSRGFEIWDVSQPANPVRRLQGLGTESVYGVALWKQNGGYYLALRTDTEGRFYDVSCLASGCGGLASPLATRQLDTGTQSFFVTFSRSGSTPFVYFGSDDRCQGGSQREWLFDVTNPASPRDVSPNNYWGWYYRGGATGFNNTMPRYGKFVGNYFYRAALSLFDIHKWNQGGSPSPSIFVGGPTSGNPGDQLTFTANAAVCAPNPAGWSWGVSGGTISGAANGSSIQVAWSTSGQKSVTAQNSSCGGATGLRTVQIAELGAPSLEAIFGFSPTSPQPGQQVTFDATASKGNPQTYSWTFGDGTGGSGVITTHTYPAAASYVVNLTVTAPSPSCVSGTCTARTQRIVVVGAPPQPDATFTTDAPCTNMFGTDVCQAQVGHAVSFAASSPDPLIFTWNFGDGSAQASGRSVTHVFTKTGNPSVSLGASNGQQTVFRTKLFNVTNGLPTCSPSATHLCLDGSRFQVDVAWTTPQGGSGVGQAVPITDNTGYFWFFNSANVEMLIKVLDACGLGQKFWVFAGGLTNVKADITVTDTKTGAVKVYHNPLSTPFQPVQDTSAFSCNGQPSAAAPAAVGEAAAASSLLLGNGRFQVDVAWATPQGQSGIGKGVALTSDTGYFWFFDPSNVEMVIKVLDGCGLNQHFWTFAGGLTNVKVDVTVTDTRTGTVKHYANRQSTQFKPIQDTSAFPTCP